MKKTILPLIVVIIIFFIISLIFLSKAVLPSKLKTELIKTLEEHLERKVELSEIKINLFKGILLENLVIYDNPKYSQSSLLNIKEASLNLSWLSILLKKKFIVTSINVNTAEFRIIRLEKNLWNFSDFINQKTKQDSKKPSLVIYKIAILNSKVSFEDRTISPLFLETLEDLNLKINISLVLNVKFNLEAKIKDKEPYCLLYSKGNYSLKNKNLLADIKIKNVLLNEYYPYFKIESLQLKGAKLQDSDIRIILENRKLQILAKAKIDDLNLQQGQIELLGALNVETNLGYDPDSKEKLAFSGNINMQGSSLKGIPLLSSIENIAGAIDFDNNKIQTKDLTGLSLDCPVKLSGILDNFSNPSINLNIDSDIKLSNIINIIPEKIKSNFSELNGNLKLELGIQGYLRNIRALDYKGKAKITDSFVKLNLLPDKLLNIQADINFNKDTIGWQNFSCQYKNFNMISNGSLNNFVNPIVEADLKSDIFDFKTKINLGENKVGISKLEGRYLNSNFDLSGDLDITEKLNPLLNLSISSAVLQLADLKEVLPKYSEQLKKVNLGGLITVKGGLSGKLKDWRNWLLDIKADSAEISLFELKLNDSHLQLAQSENMTKDFSLKSVVYDGPVVINGAIGLSDNLPYLINLNLSGLNLSKLILDTPLKDKPISGMFSAQIQIKGNIPESSSISGTGKFEIKDGNLWQLSLLKGLGDFLSLPEFDKIILNAAYGDFIIENKTVHTDNLTFVSNELNLACEGNINFDKNIDFLIASQFSDTLIGNSANLRKLITSVFDEASKVLSIKLSGTINEPKYSVVLKPMEYFKNLLEGLGLDIF